MELQASAEGFKTYVEVVRRRAATTVYEYHRTVTRFADWANERGITDTTSLTSELMTSWVIAKGPALADNTFNGYLSHLRHWLQWLASEGHLGEDGAPWRTLIPRERPLPAKVKQFIRHDEAYQVAKKAEDWHPRDRYFLEGLRGSARRRSELAALTYGDLDLTPRPDFSRGVYTFDNTKGRKLRKTLGIPPEFRQSLDEWLPLYAKLIRRPLENDDYLYPALKIAPGNKAIKGLRMSLAMVPKKKTNKNSISDILSRVTNKGAHAFRRGMAVDVDSDRTRAGHGDGMVLAQILLDHESPKTTAVYMDHDQQAADLAGALDQMYGTPEAPAQQAPEESGHEVIDMASFRARMRGSA